MTRCAVELLAQLRVENCTKQTHVAAASARTRSNLRERWTRQMDAQRVSTAWYRLCTCAVHVVGRRNTWRGALVGGHPARRGAAADRLRRRRQRRCALLQPRTAARALQHGRHAQGAAHRPSDHRVRVLFGHGPDPLLHHRRHLRLARSAVRTHRRRADRRALRSNAIPGTAQSALRERPRRHAGGARQVRARRARPRRKHQFLQQGSGRRGRRRCKLASGHCQGRSVRRPALRNGHDRRCCMPGRIRSRPATKYAPPAIRLQARRGTPPAADDPCRTRCPENARGFINTERMYAT